MAVLRALPLILSILLVLTLRASAQQTSPALQDPQAVSVLGQALAIAGGATAIATITDYTASGQITLNWNPPEQGSVTIQALGLDQLRLDANLSAGIRSQVTSGRHTTIKAESGAISQLPPTVILPGIDSPYQAPMFGGALVLPWAQLSAVLNSSRFSISYKGVVQVNSRSVHDVQAQTFVSGQNQGATSFEYNTVDFFIDTSSLQVVTVQTTLPKHVVHTIRYANYKVSNSVLVPFSISEEMDGQQTWDIELSQISFNTGVQDSAFALQ